jgi:hypothetical protein
MQKSPNLVAALDVRVCSIRSNVLNLSMLFSAYTASSSIERAITDIEC